MPKKIYTQILRLPRYPLLWIIRLYQKTLSPDHGPAKHLFAHGYCPFHPTCSEYGYDVVCKYGLVKGVPKMIWRILRCHPWTKGGVDIP